MGAHRYRFRILELERAVLFLNRMILELEAKMTTLQRDAQGNLVVDGSPVPDLTGLTMEAVLKLSVACAIGTKFRVCDGSSARVAAVKGVFRAAAGAAASCLVVPEGGYIDVTGLSGTDAVAFAAGQVLFAAPDGTIGPLATLAAHSGWSGNYETAQVGVINDDGAGGLKLTVNIKIGVPL